MGTTKITVRRTLKKKNGESSGTIFSSTAMNIIPESPQKLKVRITGENGVRYVKSS